MTEEKKTKRHAQKYKTIFKNLSKNNWAISTVLLSILLLAVFVFTFSGNVCGATITSNEAGQKVVEFLSNQGTEAEVVSVSETNGLYEVILTANGQEGALYITKDGNNLIPQPIPLTANVIQDASEETQTSTPTEVPKSDKPTVELFVMTHCPYGTQAEKGFIPLLESFDKANAKIRFVHYFMHEPEETETPRQVCIREEQSDKFLPYLREFLKEGNSADAIQVAGIDTIKMNECISSGKAEEYYNEDKALSESYGVQGSPTLVINGEIIRSGRDSASYLAITCAAFNDAPEECESLELSSIAPAPMWGWETSGSNSAAQC